VVLSLVIQMTILRSSSGTYSDKRAKINVDHKLGGQLDYLGKPQNGYSGMVQPVVHEQDSRWLVRGAQPS